MNRSFLGSFCAAALGLIISGCGSARDAVPAAPSAPSMPSNAARIDATGAAITVANSGTSGILQFPADANGNVSPARRLTGSMTQLSHPLWVGVDQASLVYAPLAAIKGYPIRIGVFTPNESGDAAPVRVITDAISTHQLVAMAVDPSGTVYVLYSAPIQHYGIDEFPPGANGVLTPYRQISGKDTLMDVDQSIISIAVQPNGAVFWASSGLTGPARVVGYAPAATGNGAPAIDIEKSAKTLIQAPSQLAIDETGSVYVETTYDVS